MIRHLLRPVAGFSLLFCLVLAGCSGQPEKKAANVTPAPELNAKVRQRLAELNQRMVRIHERIQEMDDEQVRQLNALTSETVALQDGIAALDSQLGIKPPAALARSIAASGRTAAPSATAAPEEQPVKGGGPLGPLARGLLIVIALFAIWIMARIFLGRLGEEEEDDDEFGGGDASDEDLSTEEGPVRRLDPEVRTPGEGASGEAPQGGAGHERDEPRP